MTSSQGTFNLCVKYMTWILNLAFYTLFFNFAMIFVFRLGSRAIGDWEILILIGIMELAFLFFFGRHLYRKIVADDPQETNDIIVIGRYATTKKYCLAGIVADLFFFILGWIVLGERLNSIYSVGFLAMFPLGGILLGIMVPETHGSKRLVVWINLGIISGCIFFFLLFVAYSSTPRNIHYQSAGFAPESYYSLTRSFVRRMMPRDAKNIEITGNTGLGCWGFNVSWTCSVPEEAFLRFAKSNNYALKENDPCYNANPETNHQRIDSSTLLSLKKLPDSFWYYSYRYRNNGGWVMLYDRNTQKLYGSYGSN